MPIHSSPRQPIRSNRNPYASADNAKPSPHEPCSTPLMKPRERAGQDFHGKRRTGRPFSAKQTIRVIAEELDAHRKRVLAEHPQLTLTGLYNVLEKLRAGTKPDELDGSYKC